MVAANSAAAAATSAALFAPSESASTRATVEVQREAAAEHIREALINKKVNACPMAIRVAWHASGTFDQVTTQELKPLTNRLLACHQSCV